MATAVEVLEEQGKMLRVQNDQIVRLNHKLYEARLENDKLKERLSGESTWDHFQEYLLNVGADYFPTLFNGFVQKEVESRVTAFMSRYIGRAKEHWRESDNTATVGIALYYDNGMFQVAYTDEYGEPLHSGVEENTSFFDTLRQLEAKFK